MNSSTTKPRRSTAEQTRLETTLREIFEQRMPFNEVLGLKIESAAPAAPRLSFAMRPELVGTYQHQRLHGGVIAAVLDTVGGLALALVVAEKHADETTEQIVARFTRFGTIDLRVDYLQQGIGQSFYASASVVRLGGRIASVRMELTNDAGVLIATGAAPRIVRLRRLNLMRRGARMEPFPLTKAFTLLEPGPVVLVTTHDGAKANIMTISWTMVVDFTPLFALTTGPWNYSFAALQKTKECVLAIPTVDLLDTVVGIGTCSGTDTDKFAKFRLTSVPGAQVKAPLIRECLANIECRVVDIVKKHSIVVLAGVAAHVDGSRKERRMLHAVGDGTFIVDGRTLNRREMMRAKLAEGV